MDAPASQPNRSQVAALIPCYGEAAHVGGVVEGTLAVGVDPIVVDDGSPDGTAGTARRAGAVKVIVHETNRGKGAAMTTGLRHVLDAGYGAVVLLDGDGQHLPAEIPRFLEAWRAGDCDVVLGTRMTDHRGMPLVRLLTNRFMSRLISRRTGRRISDSQCGFRLLSRRAAELALEGASADFAADAEMLLRFSRAGLRFAEVPVSTVYGNEKSRIRPFRDAVRFFAMLRKYR